jgi:hypothetical protein
MKSLGIKHYRMSFSWPRLVPDGQIGKTNAAGVTFYNSLINELLLNGITVYGTLYHWDMPQRLQVVVAASCCVAAAAPGQGRWLSLMQKRCNWEAPACPAARTRGGRRCCSCIRSCTQAAGRRPAPCRRATTTGSKTRGSSRISSGAQRALQSPASAGAPTQRAAAAACCGWCRPGAAQPQPPWGKGRARSSRPHRQPPRLSMSKRRPQVRRHGVQ